jgi:hypothetical protein
MAINFNTEPYYDDFSADKDFHRILFKPGVAVQARELTQLQTILQNQISKFGDHIFQDGSRVIGAETYIDNKVKSVRLKPTYSGNDIDVTEMLDLYVRGTTSGFIGEVKYVYAADDPTVGDPPTIIIKPANTVGSFVAEETLDFYPTMLDALDETDATTIHADTVADTIVTKTSTSTEFSQEITVSSTTNLHVGDAVTTAGLDKTLYVVEILNSTTVKVNEYVGANFTSVTFTFAQTNTQTTLEASVNEGVYFRNGYFVRTGPQSVIPQKYSSFPTASVGMSISESTVDSEEDQSLLDPAAGTYNYFAPGADRFKIHLTLTSLELNADNPVLTNNPDFIEIIRIKEGVVTKEVKVPIYSELEKSLARRTFDESGNYIVMNFILYPNETTDAAANVIVDILPGKAYVNGYEVETIAPTQASIDKARDTESVEGFDVSTFYGLYAYIDSPGYSLPAFGSNVELHSSTTYSSGTKIGTALVKQVQYDSGTNTSAVYKLFLNEINLTSGTFANVRSFVTVSANPYNAASTTFLANVDPTLGISGGAAQLYDAGYDTLIFPIPQNNIESVTSTSYEYRKLFSSIPFTSGTATITTNSSAEDFAGGSGVLPGSTARTYYQVVVRTASGTYARGQKVPMDGSGRSITIPVVGANSVGQAVFNLNDVTFSGTCDIYATIEVQSDTRKSKTLLANVVQSLNIASANVFYTLGKSDILSHNKTYRIPAGNVYAGAWSSATTYPATVSSLISYQGLVYTANASSTNIIPVGNTTYWTAVTPQANVLYTLDNGQKDNYYDHGAIKYTGASAPGNVIVIFDYFTHSGGQGFFNVDSYPIDYSKIPSYTTKSSGATYQLRDVYDFRPRRTDGASTLVYDSYQIPTPYQYIESDHSYYLGRIDKIALAQNGSFKVIKGVSSFTNPGIPADDQDAMTLFTIAVPPYTYQSSDLAVEYSNRRRYTMKDIGQIDQRLKNVEYYTALNFLEKEALASTVLDNNNSALFKNGYLVDSFAGHSVGDVLNSDYRVSIDSMMGYARAPFDSNSLEYTFNSGANPDVVKTGDLITFPYTTALFVKQNIASKVINVNPFNVTSFIGRFKITPASDTWYDTVSRPIINVVNEGDKDAWLSANNAAGTQWNDWQLNWSGQQVLNTQQVSQSWRGDYLDTVTRDTVQTTNRFARSGIQTSVGTRLVLNSDNTSVVSQEVIPFARSTTISFEVFNMPPSTRLYLYANNIIDISAFVTPTGGSIGSAVLTDSNGYASGSFVIPNTSTIKIPTGKIRFSFVDSNVSFAEATAFADSGFTSSGTLNTEQRTIISTKEPVLIRNNVADNKTTVDVSSRLNTTSQYYAPQGDPLAQTFIVSSTTHPNGVYLSSVDLFFATKDTAVPVFVQLRPTVNGYPSSSTVIPLSEVYKNPSDVNVPLPQNIYDGIGPSTNFAFEGPVYLAPGEYALIVGSSSNKYNTYAAEVGQNVLNTTTKITAQPHLGSLFKSQNASTWTPSQSEDLCFQLNQCVFERGTVSFTLQSQAPDSALDFDLTKAITQELNFGTSTSTNYEIKTKIKSTGAFTDFTPISLGSNFEFAERMTTSVAGDIVTRVTMTNTDQNVSPAVDLERVSSILVKNRIDPYSTAINNSELLPFGGLAQAKYITRRVTLADGFDATGINVNLLVNRRPGTTIKVYYKILNKYDTTDFDNRPYVEIPITTLSGDVIVANNPDQYSEENYQALNIAYTAGSASYADFNVFAIKVAFFSQSDTVIPQIKALRVTAVS